MKSIILKDHEVRGLLDGRLTQLRRVVKHEQSRLCGDTPQPFTNAPDWWSWGPDGEDARRCPFGVPGEKRWVRGTLPRLTIEIVRTWVERVQEISDDDCAACGIIPYVDYVGVNLNDGSAIERDVYEDPFMIQWDSDNPRNPYSSNPWTWAAEIKLAAQPQKG